MPDNSTQVTNHLIHEKSPYLLQHAYNPVEWFPWGEEAFDKAKEENKPIFLSIGYSTCHWCHVMAHESFEDTEVAKLLNNNFVSIKVDREERPDIDQIYMSVCQAITGQGGWPLTVFLTPEQKPFYAGTYFPKNSIHGHMGLIDLLESISKKWKMDYDFIVKSSEELTEMLNNMSSNEEKNLDTEIFKKAFDYFDSRFDTEYGGFSQAPKFPTPHNLLYLLRYYKAFKIPRALDMVETTLKQMYKGGIFDHIGYGFSRYATDRKWLIPHFEKMLYDNALLVMTYTEAYQVTGNIFYRNVSEQVITYVLRDLKSPEGGFYCAEDADSEGVEGKFYLWTRDEIINTLGETKGAFFLKYYPVTEMGNFEEKTIINLLETPLEEIEEDHTVKEKLDEMVYDLFHQREKRIHPHKDDKILTSWNGLMIAALAIAGRVYNNLSYIEHAQEAVKFIETKMVRGDGRLMARYREGDVKNLAYLDDYAFLIWGYVELYEAIFHTKYLEKAIELTENMLDLFEDVKQAGLYLSGRDAKSLISRPKEAYDGAIPSGNSVAAYNLMRLSKMTGNLIFEEKANRIINYFAGLLNKMPVAYTMMLTTKLFSEQPTKEIVLAGKREDTIIRGMVDIINKKYLPFCVVLLNKEKDDLKKVNKFTENQFMLEGHSTAYVCENFTCREPVIDVDAFNRLV